MKSTSRLLLFGVLALLTTVGVANAQSLTNGLTFYAPFTSSLNDIQGGKVGTSAGGASRPASGGVSGGYLRLTNSAAGVEQYVFYSDPTPATGDFSFQVWVRATNPQNGQPVADPSIAANKDWHSGGNVGWVLAEENADLDKFQWNMNTAGGARKDLDPVGVATAKVFDGTWHQLVVTYQRNGSAVFYRDGVGIGSVDISGNVGQSMRPSLGTWVTNNFLALGQDATLRYDEATGTGVTSFNGDVDEVAMWNRVLSAVDVANAFSKGTNGVTLDAPLAPSFTQQPQGGTRFTGENFLLSCAVAGDPAPSLQWWKEDQSLNGATGNQLLLTNLSPADAGNYTVVATGGGLSITSDVAKLTVISDTNLTGTIADVRHVVIFMQENRAFDHYFGTLKGVRGFGDRNALLFQNGATDFYQPNGAGYLLPFATTNHCLAGTGHDWGTTHTAWHSGKWDQWVPAKGTTTMSFYTRNELPFYFALAEAFTICDAYHCSVMGPTNPNRLYLWTGMVDPDGTGGGPITDNSEPASGFTWTTYPERLEAAGISWRVYQAADNYDDNALAWFAQYKNAAPGTPLHDRGVATVSDLVGAFQSDVLNGTLPQVSWLIAPAAQSEHPSYSPDSGENLTKQFLDALHGNPAVYKSTVFILNYDENDGLFDHVVPPIPPPGTASEFVGGLPIGLGVRVPLIIISPWTRGGYLCSQVFDHSSIIRFLESWTGVQEPNISAWRRKVCGDLTSAFDFKNPNMNYPSLPTVSGISCPGGITPTVPAIQTMPAQEPGTLFSRPLPYQPNASCSNDCPNGRLYFTMTNSGTAAVHFSVYPNAYRTDGPWQYDVANGGAVTDSLSLTGGLYDVTCYGPNGFQRRFAGNGAINCNLLEVSSEIHPGNLSLILYLRNSTGTSTDFTVTNGYTGALSIYSVPPGTTMSQVFSTEDQNGWYDLTVTASVSPGLLRRLAGHIETQTPRIRTTLSGDQLALTYPDWANAYVLESSSNLLTGTWAPVGTNPIILSNRTIIVLSNLTSAAYFRLRH